MKYLTTKQNIKQKFQMEEDYLGTEGSGRSGHISITLWSRCGGGMFPGRLREKTEIYRQWVSFAYLIDMGGVQKRRDRDSWRDKWLKVEFRIYLRGSWWNIVKMEEGNRDGSRYMREDGP